MISERIKSNRLIARFLRKPELFIPLTYHFHIFEKSGENRYVVFLYPREDTRNVKVEEYLQKFLLIHSISSSDITYLLDNDKGIIYKIHVSLSFKDSYVNIGVFSEKKGLFKSLPISEDHILSHIIDNLRYLSEEE
ncbi:hypothetical protein [Sulfurisphaera ohwakuensis]|uniref:hypothetical protein n=1 Tax=Sulfurisphaera ohwakuensis TaxID=69656 RepID=UPI0036F211D4